MLPVFDVTKEFRGGVIGIHKMMPEDDAGNAEKA